MLSQHLERMAGFPFGGGRTRRAGCVVSPALRCEKPPSRQPQERRIVTRNARILTGAVVMRLLLLLLRLVSAVHLRALRDSVLAAN